MWHHTHSEIWLVCQGLGAQIQNGVGSLPDPSSMWKTLQRERSVSRLVPNLYYVETNCKFMHACVQVYYCKYAPVCEINSLPSFLSTTGNKQTKLAGAVVRISTVIVWRCYIWLFGGQWLVICCLNEYCEQLRDNYLNIEIHGIYKVANVDSLLSTDRSSIVDL